MSSMPKLPLVGTSDVVRSIRNGGPGKHLILIGWRGVAIVIRGVAQHILPGYSMLYSCATTM